MIQIKIAKADITQIDADAIVNPANSLGYMAGGAAGAIKAVGGMDIEQEAIEAAPIPLGHAILTTAGMLKAGHVIHAVTMQQPGTTIPSSNIGEAARAALELADENKLERIAIPGMGTGIGGVGYLDAAREIANAILNFQGEFPKQIILCDINQEVIEAFHNVFGV